MVGGRLSRLSFSVDGSICLIFLLGCNGLLTCSTSLLGALEMGKGSGW